MNRFSTTLLHSAARLLPADEREAVLGDLQEADETAAAAVTGILGLVTRRELGLWREWRPWVAAFAIAVPASFLLMGSSLAVASAWLHPGDAPFAWLGLAGRVARLAGCATGVGYAVGSLSRRTLWASAIACFFPCLFCWSRFRLASPPRYCLLLFLVPAVVGALIQLYGRRPRPANL